MFMMKQRLTVISSKRTLQQNLRTQISSITKF